MLKLKYLNWKNMSKIIGIDLGTTYSAIAQLDDLGNPEGYHLPMKIEKLLQALYMLVAKRLL